MQSQLHHVIETFNCYLVYPSSSFICLTRVIRFPVRIVSTRALSRPIDCNGLSGLFRFIYVDEVN